MDRSVPGAAGSSSPFPGGSRTLRLSIPQGPEVGRTLYAVLDAVMDGKCPNRKEDLLRWIENMKRPVQ